MPLVQLNRFGFDPLKHQIFSTSPQHSHPLRLQEFCNRISDQMISFLPSLYFDLSFWTCLAIKNCWYYQIFRFLAIAFPWTFCVFNIRLRIMRDMRSLFIALYAQLVLSSQFQVITKAF